MPSTPYDKIRERAAWGRTFSNNKWTEKKENAEKGTLGGRTSSQEKRTENELFMKVDHFGSGGRRSDSRLGRRGKKLGDCGIVAKSRFLKFLDFSFDFFSFLKNG